jgi:hypothetical protein
MENIDTASRPKKTAYLTHFSRSCHFCGSWVWKRLRPTAWRSCRCLLQRAERAHPAAEQAAPEQEHGDDDEDPEQEDERIGQEQRPGPLEQQRVEPGQHLVMEGWAMAPKPIQKMLMAQPVYLKPLTGHLFLWVDGA